MLYKTLEIKEVIMKKATGILLGLLMVLACVGLTACGGGSSDSTDLSDSPYVGEWVSTGMSMGDETGEFDYEVTLTLNADGTGVLTGDGESSEFTWTPTENGFKTEGDVNTKFKADGDNAITAKVIGVNLNFVRAGSEEAEKAEAPATDGSEYGYTGEDPVVAAVYKYLAEDLAKEYQPDADTLSVPVVCIVATKEGEDGTTDVYGDFWINNYKVEGDTLKTVSGGNHPGVMHVAKDGDSYVVTSFDQVADGGEFESSAKEIFGDDYDAFMKIYSDSDAIDKERAAVLAAYVKANDLAVTKYQDEGWDPVDLAL